MNVIEVSADGIALWYCPACKHGHGVPIEGQPGRQQVWKFNNRKQKPTLTPSVIVRDLPKHSVCHSTITEGVIEFMKDSTHSMAGKTFTMKKMPQDEPLGPRVEEKSK